ncbi:MULTISPECIES: hypothetical protein [unclassified Paenibacillus]|uniref:hypothetical protein n=1 Tax=unclassified Paenibacillus TaxID=185978 RepID=UPI0002D48319|nr:MULTISPECIES: hypothetical protein [unclassified Paenibacillus]MCM3339085.1 hypothetical protein [Paenibacillus sp. MER TA 81-3]
MERQPYYVSVQRRTVVTDPSSGSYEFVIEATGAEREHLQALIDDLGDAETDAFRDCFMLVTIQTNEKINIPYQQRLHAVYMYIHKLGAADTKRFVEQMFDQQS